MNKTIKDGIKCIKSDISKLIFDLMFYLFDIDPCNEVYLNDLTIDKIKFKVEYDFNPEGYPYGKLENSLIGIFELDLVNNTIITKEQFNQLHFTFAEKMQVAGYYNTAIFEQIKILNSFIHDADNWKG